jgi:ribosomal protein L7/L12
LEDKPLSEEQSDKPYVFLENVPQEVQELVIAGQKIEAIKKVRESTGMGLKDSKDMVEKVARELAEKNEGLEIPQKAGCAAFIAIGVSLAAIGKLLINNSLS